MYDALGVANVVGSVIPVLIGSGYSAITAVGSQTWALKTDGSLWAWGDIVLFGPVQPTAGQAATSADRQRLQCLSASGSHTLALKTDGSLWAWGFNSYGQLGDGTTAILYATLCDRQRLQRCCGGPISLGALKTDGSLWVWGERWVAN